MDHQGGIGHADRCRVTCSGRNCGSPERRPMEIRMRTVLASVVAVLSATACRYVPLADPVSLSEAGRAIRAEDLMRNVTALSSDEFEGRGPGTVGEERTLAYLQSQFELAGAQPGNPAGGWLQEVPLVGFTAKAHMQ